MAKKSKQTNGINASVAASFIGRLEGLEADIASSRDTYIAEAKNLREDIKEIYSEARDNGIPVRALKAEIKARDYERKTKALKAGLDIDELSAFEQLEEALKGLVDLPLGQAAMDAQRRKDGKEFDLAGGGKKPKGKTSPEEAAALADVKNKGIIAAIGDQTATYAETAAT